MREMTEAEWSDFLRHSTRTAKLSVNLPSGRPTVTPVWFLYEDEVLRIETGRGSAKARALAADPRACIVVDLEEPPYGFVKIDARARIVDDDPQLTTRVATAVGARYMGPERAEEFGRRNSGPGQVVIEFIPTRITAIADVTG